MSITTKVVTDTKKFLKECFGEEDTNYLVNIKTPPFKTTGLPELLISLTLTKNGCINIVTSRFGVLPITKAEEFSKTLFEILHELDCDKIQVIVHQKSRIVYMIYEGSSSTDEWFCLPYERIKELTRKAKFIPPQIYDDRSLNNLAQTFNITNHTAILVWREKGQMLIPRWFGLGSLAEGLLAKSITSSACKEAHGLGSVVKWYLVFKTFYYTGINALNSKTQDQLEQELLKLISKERHTNGV